MIVSMLRMVYSLLWRVAVPLIALRVWLRARHEPLYGIYVGERFGVYRRAMRSPVKEGYSAAPIWIHAVSLGETRAAEPLINALLERGLPVLLTHMTATGRAEGTKLFDREIKRGVLRQVWLPYDLPGATRRFFRHFMPRCGLLVETEVWPNLVQSAKRYGVPVALVNARMSEKSMKANLQVATFAKFTFGALDKVLAQTQQDADRLASLGAVNPKVAGNLKYDVNPPAELLQAGKAFRTGIGRPVIAIASTRAGEEVQFLKAILGAREYPSESPLVILIPRHPQRCDAVTQQVAETGLRYQRRSQIAGPFLASHVGHDVGVVIGDSVGEMPFYYAASDVSIVAGSFEPHGGQNLIEACACGAPVIVGPHTYNFSEASEDAIKAGAALRVATAKDAWAEALALIQDPERRDAMREAAVLYGAAHTGATNRLMMHLSEWLL